MHKICIEMYDDLVYDKFLLVNIVAYMKKTINNSYVSAFHHV